jgi:hypothetical protein
MMTTTAEEPATVAEALQDPNWAKAMESEHQALLQNKTCIWYVPQGAKTLLIVNGYKGKKEGGWHN